jgi:hypothetical protein
MNEEVRECESCSYPIGDRGETYKTNASSMDIYLCDLCASTLVGSMSDHPRAFDHQTRCLGQTICYVGNAILEAIAKQRRDPP